MIEVVLDDPLHLPYLHGHPLLLMLVHLGVLPQLALDLTQFRAQLPDHKLLLAELLSHPLQRLRLTPRLRHRLLTHHLL